MKYIAKLDSGLLIYRLLPKPRNRVHGTQSGHRILAFN
jgi:hypothetical protein